ncbi:hypothetical protein EVAR_97631_1 [Eumeta japonica]|uniref:Uncharacterized protein n=1 Tax=Eumeta variegata TaxID=151549 RepID=A0A4C2AA85_EUMVA|nr:hypothetical protein EVAR_97631_1 [Eumeta japonica]
MNSSAFGHSCPQQVLRLVGISRRALKPNSTVAVFFDVAKAFDRQTDISHLGMSALTRQDVLSEQEFLKAPSLLCCTPRTQTMYRDRRRLASNSRYSRTIPRSFTEIGIGAPDSPSSPQRAIDELGQWFRKWRIEVNPTNQQPYNSSMDGDDIRVSRLRSRRSKHYIDYRDLELPTISNMKDASKRFFDIAGSHPNALLRAAVDYQPPHPTTLSVGHETYLPIHLTLLQRQLKANDVNDTHD